MFAPLLLLGLQLVSPAASRDALHEGDRLHDDGARQDPATRGGCFSFQGDEELERAYLLLDQARLEEAEKAFRAIVAEKPEHARAWFLLAYTVHSRAVRLAASERRTETLNEALELHLHAARFEIVKPTALYNAACACALLGRTDDAFAYLDQAFGCGFDRRGLVPMDPDLASLRGDRRFAKYLPVEDPSKLFKGDVRVLFTFEGESAGDQFGWEGRNAGDVDADGTNDILLSAPFRSEDGANAGKVYVYSGATGTLLFAHTGIPGATLGVGIESAGDVDGDGHADVLASATFSGRAPGIVYVYSGRSGEQLHTLTAGERGDLFGARVTGMGDFDDDGSADIAVGAPGSDHAGKDAGRVYLFSGSTGRRLLALDGEKAGDEFGDSISAVRFGDQRLVAVGAGGAGRAGRGRVYVYDYQDRSARLRFPIEADQTGVQLGHLFLSFLGDIDGDGFPDVYVADWENNARGYTTGRIYVHSGDTGKRLLRLTGEHQGDAFGTGPATAGDIDGDGYDDLIVGSWRSDEGAQGAGKCTVFTAAGEVLMQIVCTAAGDAFGYGAVGLGDIDKDGGIDFLITAARSNVRGKKSGRAFVIAGPRPACMEQGPLAKER